MIDLHAHILPGVDDGATDLAMALDMLVVAAEDGITEIAATPHFIQGSFAPPGPEVRAGVAKLAQEAEARGIAITIHPGHEVRAAAGLVERIRSGEVLALDPQRRYLLLEMPGSSVPDWMGKLVFELEVAGITPVIAHPERNMGVIRNPMRLHELIENGCRTQITAGSFLGYFGKHAAETARVLLEHDMVHVVASDAHDNRSRTPSLSAARAVVAEIAGEDVAEALFASNPRAVWNGLELAVPEPIPLARDEEELGDGLWGRFRGMFGRDT